MTIFIIGAGFTGMQLAKMLVLERNKVVLIDNDAEKVRHASDALDCTVEYDKERDCVLYASAAKVRSLDADPSAWFVFFPSDLHRPGMAKDATPSPVRKVVVKIPVAE